MSDNLDHIIRRCTYFKTILIS